MATRRPVGQDGGMTPLWTGTAVALATLFDPDGGLAADATAEHAARLVEAGVRAVLVSGSTGEAAALTDDERVELVRAVRRACPDVPIVAGASGEWWQPAADRAAAAVKAGADAVLVAPPRGATDLAAYFGRIVDTVGGTPVLAYHFPPTAGGPVPVEALPSLPVPGLKDSSGDPERLLRELELGLTVYVGAVLLTAYAAGLGATGTILAAANLNPEDCVAAWDGDLAAQRRLLATHLTCRDRYPHGLKAAMAARYGTPATARLG
jgi:dihydrodipicolinate synthase/N-acetylneuraminate lyase